MNGYGNLIEAGNPFNDSLDYEFSFISTVILAGTEHSYFDKIQALREEGFQSQSQEQSQNTFAMGLDKDDGALKSVTMIGLYHHLIQTLIKRSQVSKQLKSEGKGRQEMETDEQIVVDNNAIYRLDQFQQ